MTYGTPRGKAQAERERRKSLMQAKEAEQERKEDRDALSKVDSWLKATTGASKASGTQTAKTALTFAPETSHRPLKRTCEGCGQEVYRDEPQRQESGVWYHLKCYGLEREWQVKARQVEATLQDSLLDLTASSPTKSPTLAKSSNTKPLLRSSSAGKSSTEMQLPKRLSLQSDSSLAPDTMLALQRTKSVNQQSRRSSLVDESSLWRFLDGSALPAEVTRTQSAIQQPRRSSLQVDSSLKIDKNWARRSSLQADSSLKIHTDKKRHQMLGTLSMPPASINSNGDYLGNVYGMFQNAASVVESSVVATFHSPDSTTPTPTKVDIVPAAGLESQVETLAVLAEVQSTEITVSGILPSWLGGAPPGVVKYYHY